MSVSSSSLINYSKLYLMLVLNGIEDKKIKKLIDLKK